MIKGCPKLHRGCNPEDNYCWMCGTKLENLETPRCSCGRHFVTEDVFCANCGINKETHLTIVKKQKEDRIKAQKQFEGKVSG